MVVYVSLYRQNHDVMANATLSELNFHSASRRQRALLPGRTPALPQGFGGFGRNLRNASSGSVTRTRVSEVNCSRTSQAFQVCFVGPEIGRTPRRAWWSSRQAHPKLHAAQPRACQRLFLPFSQPQPWAQPWSSPHPLERSKGWDDSDCRNVARSPKGPLCESV